jgi:hypothetical protein
MVEYKNNKFLNPLDDNDDDDDDDDDDTNAALCPVNEGTKAIVVSVVASTIMLTATIDANPVDESFMVVSTTSSISGVYIVPVDSLPLSFSLSCCHCRFSLSSVKKRDLNEIYDRALLHFFV